MDLNYLYHRVAVSLMRSQAANCDQVREAHAKMARGYQDRIADQLQRKAA